MRSCHNVGSLLRTAEGLGVETVYLTGYTPYPLAVRDNRLPHLANKLDTQISKTALGAQTLQNWQHSHELQPVIETLKSEGYCVIGLEQAPTNQHLPTVTMSLKVAILLGAEVTGLTDAEITLCDQIYEIPMLGQKESFNVVQAAAMAMYQARFF